MYLPEHEKKLVLETLHRLVKQKKAEVGRPPAIVTIGLQRSDFGEAQSVEFLLVGGGEFLEYEAFGTFEVDGVPGNRLVERIKA